MKQLNILFLLMCCTLALQAQDIRYADEIFSDVNVETNVVYGNNISVLTGAPAPTDLLMDVYTPVGDEPGMARPTVIYLHTGSFLPKYFNGGITGDRQDSTVVEVCTRLAKRGYTAIAATYRQGWVPTATGPDGQNTRTGTLLNAAYRGIQDARTCIRFLRMTVDLENNPYGVDGDRIVLWGQGTGGYISLGAATLEDYQEIVLPKFIDTETALPYVIEELNGDPYGLNQTQLNIPNWTEYSSDFQLCINMGGALGDTSWIETLEERPNQPPIMGYHVVTDPFAPFGDGPVIVPVTNDFVVQVGGTRLTVQTANEKGVNDAMTPVLGDTDPASAFLNARVNGLSAVPIDLSALGQTPTTLATEHMYPFLTPNFRIESGPWDWWSKPQLDLVIAGINQALETDFNADTLHNNGLITNPDMSADKARTYLDTVFTYYIPRACQVLQLEECAIVLDTEDILPQEQIAMSVAPNPAVDQAMVRTAVEYPMETIQIFDFNGRIVRTLDNINNNEYNLQRGNLPPGTYLVKAKFAEGISIQKVIFQ